MLEDESIQRDIRVELLLNARMYDGKPNSKAVLGKLLGKNKELRQYAKDLNILLSKLTKAISSKSLEEIEKELKELAPDAVKIEKVKKKKSSDKRREKKKKLPTIPDAVKGKFKVRYAPDPSKYPHIGQGMNFLINRMYADKYEGQVVLRFDDTNPTIVRSKYFEAIKKGLIWLGCTWDEEIRASSFLDEFYTVARDWISNNKMYVCLCVGEVLSKGRENGIACVHRTHDKDENLDFFEKMLEGNYQPGEATVRLVGDMESENNVMRDPIMYRIVKDKHEMLDKFYPVFPTYDWESSYLDWKMGITHIIRSGEFGTMRQELQSFIIKNLGGTAPTFKSFGRFNIQGCPTKGRVIRELVQSKVVTGWDDIRLITLAGLQKRGVDPFTPRLLIQEVGLTPKNTSIAWSTFEKKSKELLEPKSKHLFYVTNPIKLNITGSKPADIEIDFHPSHSDYGKRTIKVSNIVHVASSDIDDLKVGDIFRLKDLFNVKISKKSETIDVEFAGNDLIPKTKKIQWVSDDAIPITLTVPDLLEKEKNKINEDSLENVFGLIEPTITTLYGEVVQLERVGFARIFSNQMGHLVHKI